MSGGVRARAGIMPGVSGDLWWTMPVLAGQLILLTVLLGLAAAALATGWHATRTSTV